MANPIASIVIAAVDKTKAAFASITGSFKSLNDLSKTAGLNLGLISSGLSLIGTVGYLKSIVNEMDAAGKSAQKIGTSVENFSALSYAAGQSDISVEELEKGLAKLSKSLDDAKSGLTTSVDAFDRLKIDPKKFTDPADALSEISDRFKEMPNGVNKTSLAIAIFGKSGASLIPMLNEGSSGIRELTDEARTLGKVFDQDAAAAAEKFNDDLDRLKARSSGVGISISNKILPSLNQYVGAMNEILSKGSLFDKVAFFTTGFIGEDVLNKITDAGTRVKDYTQKINELKDQLAEFKRVEGGNSPNVKIWEQQIAELEKTRNTLIAAEKKANEERKKSSKDTSDALGENRKSEQEAFKKSTNEQIVDAQRLQSALQSAFEGAIRSEEDYQRQAKKLRDEANGTTPVAGDVQSQASASLDAITKAMKLQREAGTASLQSVQDQSAALQQLAGQLDDQALKNDLIKQAKLAEAAALEKAAAEEKQRYQDLSKIQDDTTAGIDHMKAALDGIGKEVSVQLKPGAGVAQVKNDLNEILGLLDQIGNRPLSVGVSATGTADIAAALRTEASKFGRRQP